MKFRIAFAAAVAVASMSLAVSADAANKEKKTYVMVNEEIGLPVFPYDITDRPYEVLGEIKTSVRKATIFSKAPSQEKIYGELWERAEKLGADAVIKAQYGDAKVTLMSWGASGATGVAIKFKPASASAPAATQTSAAQ